jgi:phosphohistidine swiveling domain-containing protein
LQAEFQELSAAELSQSFMSGKMPEKARTLVETFLERYGGRGLGEIDMGRKRWLEDPTYVFEMLGSYLRIDEGNQAPDIVFSRSAKAAQQALDHLAERVRKTKAGWLKARLVRFMGRRMREMMGIRESPKFFAVRLMGLLRQELLKSGEAFVEAGELAQADDLFFLSFIEIDSFARREARDWQRLIAQRREACRRESLRRQIPRVLLSDGRAFYEGLRATGTSGGALLTGSPVSPGSAEGRVRVVFDPRKAGLLPGEILVCPGTDPSWTPLFMSAAGLVMEVGGMMTHGAVVAREYGIPAIVGVDQVTQRLITGQLIRINGSTGQIDLLENPQETGR